MKLRIARKVANCPPWWHRRSTRRAAQRRPGRQYRNAARIARRRTVSAFGLYFRQARETTQAFVELGRAASEAGDAFGAFTAVYEDRAAP